MKYRQIRVTKVVSSMVDELLDEMKDKDPLIKNRQDVITKAVLTMHKKEVK